jgi:hypothetical protein
MLSTFISPVRASSSVPADGGRQAGHDPGKDDDGDAVADTPLRHLLTQPHQEHGAGHQGAPI